MEKRIKTLIMGAAGRDFHNFNMLYRDNPSYEVLCFTATQIPNIEGRRYPPELSGKLYPHGIPIEAEAELVRLIKQHNIEEVVFAYSDVPHEYVMHKAALVNAAGAHFKMLGVERTALKASRPVIAVCAVRTGCGKSQTTRHVAGILRRQGKKIVVVRHPMPYGDLAAQRCQRFASLEDLKRHHCTIEEMEEYEPHIVNGSVVYAGVDYGDILKQAQAEAEILLWDGGNNDTSFFRPDLNIVVVDPHRAGHETSYYPGETNLLSADVIVINKMDTADADNIKKLRGNIKKVNPRATVIEAASPIEVQNYEQIKGRRVLVIEDGPTLTHGEMRYGAGSLAAEKYGASQLVDPRPYAVCSIKETFNKYPHMGALLPAMGYGTKQIKDLEETINNTPADLVISATPIDIRRLIKINKPCLRVRYELQEMGSPTLEDVLKPYF